MKYPLFILCRADDDVEIGELENTGLPLHRFQVPARPLQAFLARTRRPKTPRARRRRVAKVLRKKNR